MDDSEKLVCAYLRHSGFEKIQYEPDGNIPPDFVADGRVAIEVRRFNQNHDDGRKRQGLEKESNSLRDKMKKLLETLGPPTRGKSRFVFYRFSRPLPDWKRLRPDLECVLRNFMAKEDPEPFEYKFGANFSLEVLRASDAHEKFFVLGGCIDEQTGGLLFQQMQENLAHCVAEKTEKVSMFRPKYPEWWLVMPDYIGFGLGNFDQQRFRETVSMTHTFDKIVLLDPRDHTRAFVI